MFKLIRKAFYVVFSGAKEEKFVALKAQRILDASRRKWRRFLGEKVKETRVGFSAATTFFSAANKSLYLTRSSASRS